MIILASKSAGRRMLLEQLGLEFEVVPGTADESSVKEKNPANLVKKLAELKADSVAGRLRGSNIVIGADTIVYFDGRIIGQPKDYSDARKTLKELLGKTHQVYTGLCVMAEGRKYTDYDVSSVTLRDAGEAEMEKYLKAGLHKGKAGSYNISDADFQGFVKKLEGSYSNVVGLPTEKLIPILRKLGVEIKGDDRYL
jgi:septum formation protein